MKGYVSAQSNPYNISPSLYPLYVKGAGMLADSGSLVWADRLMRESRHYTQGHQRESVEREAANLREVSRRNGFSRYYFMLISWR